MLRELERQPPRTSKSSRLRCQALSAGLLAACALLVPRSAVAELGARLEYTAPSGCPDQTDFERRVSERLLSESIEPKSLEQLVVRVLVEPREQRASVELRSGDGARIERSVQGRTCEELVSGVALITALAFGAHTQTEAAAKDAPAEKPAEGAEEKPKDAEVTAVPAPLDANAGTRAARSSKLTPLKPPPKARPRVVPKSELPAHAADGSEPAPDEGSEDWEDETRARRRFRAEAGAGGWMSSWLAPSRMLGVDAFARFGASSGRWSARISGAFGSSTVNIGERRAELSFYGGRLEGCPVVGRLVSRLSAEACLAAELGALQGAGRADSALLEAREQTLFWGAGVLLVRARSPLGFLVIEAQAELGIPVTGNEFVFQNPREEVFQAPDLGAAGRLGVGVPFL